MTFQDTHYINGLNKPFISVGFICISVQLFLSCLVGLTCVIGRLILSCLGGLVCVTGRLNSVEDSQEYANLIPLCDRLEKEKQWEKLEVWKYSGYHTKEDVTGIMFVYRVL